MDTDDTKLTEEPGGSKSAELVSTSDDSVTSTQPTKTNSDSVLLEDKKSTVADNYISDHTTGNPSDKKVSKCTAIGIESVETKEIESVGTKKIKSLGTEESKAGQNKSKEAGSTGEVKSSSQKIIDSEVDRSQYVHYEGEVAVYTDPQSRQQYTWDSEKNDWKLRQIDYEFDGSNYFYTDKSGSKYKWDTTSNSWVNQSISSVPLVQSDKIEDSDDEEEYDENNARKTAPPVQRQDMSKGSYGYDGDTHTYTDATDGTVYLWDKEKNAWFPKVDDDFLARYQMSYGFVDQSNSDSNKKPINEDDIKVEEKPPSSEKDKSNPSEEKVIPGQKRKPEPPKWFDIGQESTKVYVSNLPLDLTQDEFVEVMQKCGLVMKELDTNQMKIKLYTDPYTKEFKGDALCTYIKRESVDLALNILDGHVIRGKKIKVERAKFTMKGESYDPNLKPKKKRKKDLEKLKKAQEKLFDWRPDKLRGERGKNESVIVVKNLFDPALFDSDVTLILEYQQDLREESAKCGHVKKVVLHDKHPEGVAQIFFKEPEAADACKSLLNGRWFGQRQISAETWDGKTRYKVQETPEEREKRLKKWETFLEEEDRKKREKEGGGKTISEEKSNEESIVEKKSNEESIVENKSNEVSIVEKKSNESSIVEAKSNKKSIVEEKSNRKLMVENLGEESDSDGKRMEEDKGDENNETKEIMDSDGEDDSDATRSGGDTEGEE